VFGWWRRGNANRRTNDTDRSLWSPRANVRRASRDGNDRARANAGPDGNTSATRADPDTATRVQAEP